MILRVSEKMTETSTHKIMIVQEEAAATRKLQKMLTKMRYHIIGISYSGDDALEKARRLRPDLILMSIMIPGKQDGIKVAEIVKLELNIPVIFLTPSSEEKNIERAKKADPYGYILTPFQDCETRAAIEVAMCRKKKEEKLQKAHDELEHRINERTSELNTALKTLQHKETELAERKSVLERLNQELTDTNLALSVVANSIDQEKQKLENQFFMLCNGRIIPTLKQLQKDVYCQKRQADLELMISYLKEAFRESPRFQITGHYLSDQEMRVALMIQNGLSNQQIADMLYISINTVRTHRRNIRKKFNITNPKTNLGSYLRAKFDFD